MPNGDDKFLQSARATLAPGAEARRKSTEAKKALLGTEFEQTAERLRKGASREKGAFKTEIPFLAAKPLRGLTCASNPIGKAINNPVLIIQRSRGCRTTSSSRLALRSIPAEAIVS